MTMGRSSLEKEIVGRRYGRSPQGERRRKKVAVSLVGMGLGDRIILEAPLRIHRKNHPGDYLIAIVDRNGFPDLPSALRRHFDELWWISTGDGQEWTGWRRSAVAYRIRDALIAADVRRVFIPPWKTRPLPRNPRYAMLYYDCFGESDFLRNLGVYPRVTVPAADKRWAEQLLHTTLNGRYEGLISLHVRRVCFSPERNLNPPLFEAIMEWLRTRGRLAFLLFGRDDGPPELSGPDVVSFVGQKWSFERTAALIARTQLFIGGESGLTHAAAGLGVPLIGIEFIGDHARPFAPRRRSLCLYKGESPHTIMAEVRRFVERLDLRSARRR